MTDVDPKKLNQYRHLKSVKATLDAQYGPGQWGDDELGQYILERERAKAEEAERTTPPNSLSVQARYERYLARFEDVTPNDQQSILALCNLEVEMERIDWLRQSITSVVQADELKKLGDLYVRCSVEHRQLQDALGISRTMREEQSSGADEVQRLITQGADFVREHSIPIVCPACQRRSISINLGFILYHFRQDVPWRFQTVCPHLDCGQHITLQGLKNFPVDSGPNLVYDSGASDPENTSLAPPA